MSACYGKFKGAPLPSLCNGEECPACLGEKRRQEQQAMLMSWWVEHTREVAARLRKEREEAEREWRSAKLFFGAVVLGVLTVAVATWVWL